MDNHGTTDGVRDCPYPEGALAYLEKHHHACRLCCERDRSAVPTTLSQSDG
jgi:hypothetical protein